MEHLKAVYEQITSITFQSVQYLKSLYIVGHLPVKPLMVSEVNRLFKVLARAFFWYRFAALMKVSLNINH